MGGNLPPLAAPLHLKFVSICKSKRGLPNYLFKVDHKNVGVRRLIIIEKGSVTKKRLGTTALNSLQYRSVVASGGIRSRGLAPGQCSSEERRSGGEPLAMSDLIKLCPI